MGHGTLAAPAAGLRLRICLGALWLCAAFAAAAQQSSPADVKMEKIEVVGTHIARIEGESGLPVQVITREELFEGGVQTMQELLERISANQSFGGFNEALGIGTTLVGFTAASLRGLGSQRTLILLNGRRLAPYALSGGQSVDLSGIPASAIERVEILKDGASAIYGTDAIGGVINFILRKDFRGAEVNANYYGTQQGGGDNGRVNVTAGSGDLNSDKYNFFISADYFKQDALKASQRESTRTSYIPSLGVDTTSGASFPANIQQTDPHTGEVYGFRSTRNPTIPFPGGATPASCAPPYSFPTVASPFQCRFDFASVSETIPQAEKTNVIARYTWQIDADNQFFAEGSYYYGTFVQSVSPTPLSSMFTLTPMTLPPDSPYYPATYVAGLPGGDPTKPLQLAYRTVELGPRTDKANVDQWNGVVGLQGTIKGWGYQLVVNYTQNRQVDNYVSGSIFESKFGPLLRSGVVNPFGPNTDSVLELMRATQVRGEANDNRASNYGAALTLANGIYALPSGPLAVAFGLEARRESLEQSNSEFVVAGDVLGTAGAVPSLTASHRNVFSLFGEVNVPIVTSFEINVAVRYDYYSDFGGTTNPKVTLRWQPAKNLLLRGAYGTGFRAPTLSDLFQPHSLGAAEPGVTDPIRCPVTEDFYDCGGSGITLKVGGNSALRPETSQQVNAGIVVAPMSGVSASADYYWVRVKNVITIVPADVILGSDYAAWAPSYVVRDPPDQQYPELPGKIAYVVGYPTNVGTIATSGIDLNFQWRSPQWPIGSFSLSANGTYVFDFSESGYVSQSVPTAVGQRGLLGAIARYRQYAQLNWTQGAWGGTLANNYQSGYSEPCIDGDASGCATRRVGSYSVWDLQGRYTGFKNLTLAAGIRNVLNTSPPVSNQRSTFQVGIDPSYADPRGRMYYGALQYVFK
jgi:iron complex outermembrane receptor protein